MLTFLDVGFGGNMVQGFRLYDWWAMPSFLVIALFALEMQSDPSPCSIFRNEIFSDRIACYLTRLKQNIANCTTDPRVEFFHLSNRFYVTSKFNAKISTTLKLQNLGCGMWHWNHCPFSASTKNMNNTWPWLLDTWAFGSLGHFIPPLSLLSVRIWAKQFAK